MKESAWRRRLKNFGKLRLRIDYQEVTLKELGEMVASGKISKSGINHRLRKLDEIAEQARTGQTVTLK